MPPPSLRHAAAATESRCRDAAMRQSYAITPLISPPLSPMPYASLRDAL